LRFVEDLNVAGSMFSASASDRGCLLPAKIAPNYRVSIYWGKFNARR
jgi:hypothetical protein